MRHIQDKTVSQESCLYRKLVTECSDHDYVLSQLEKDKCSNDSICDAVSGILDSVSGNH